MLSTLRGGRFSCISELDVENVTRDATLGVCLVICEVVSQVVSQVVCQVVCQVVTLQCDSTLWLTPERLISSPK